MDELKVKSERRVDDLKMSTTRAYGRMRSHLNAVVDQLALPDDEFLAEKDWMDVDAPVDAANAGAADADAADADADAGTTGEDDGNTNQSPQGPSSDKQAADAASSDTGIVVDDGSRWVTWKAEILIC